MVWRTKGCGGGVGCDDSPLAPLCITQGQPLDISFAAGFVVAGQPVRAEIRHQPYGRLILDMAPYASVDPIDNSLLRIQLPAEVTAGVHSDGYYDVWVASQRIERGPAYCELSVSVLPPRQALTGSWSPTMVVGQDFVRDLDLTGLLPAGEEVSQAEDHPPQMTIEDPSGKEVVWFVGSPELTVVADGAAIHLALSVQDVATIGPGRFTYKLHAWNTLHELRTLMAGVLLVHEGSP